MTFQAIIAKFLQPRCPLHHLSLQAHNLKTKSYQRRIDVDKAFFDVMCLLGHDEKKQKQTLWTLRQILIKLFDTLVVIAGFFEEKKVNLTKNQQTAKMYIKKRTCVHDYLVGLET